MSAGRSKTGVAVIENGITAKEWLQAGRSPLFGERQGDRKRPLAPPSATPRQSVIKEAIIRWLETEL